MGQTASTRIISPNPSNGRTAVVDVNEGNKGRLPENTVVCWTVYNVSQDVELTFNINPTYIDSCIFKATLATDNKFVLWCNNVSLMCRQLINHVCNSNLCLVLLKWLHSSCNIFLENITCQNRKSEDGFFSYILEDERKGDYSSILYNTDFRSTEPCTFKAYSISRGISRLLSNTQGFLGLLSLLHDVSLDQCALSFTGYKEPLGGPPQGECENSYQQGRQGIDVIVISVEEPEVFVKGDARLRPNRNPGQIELGDWAAGLLFIGGLLGAWLAVRLVNEGRL